MHHYQDAYCHIVEQPSENAQRFRYDCEARAGCIPGRNSTAELRTFPTLQIENYTGPVIAVVSCVSHMRPYVPHPNQLVGPTAKYGCLTRAAVITAACKTIQFSDISIQCIKRTEVLGSLELRMAKRIDPFKTGYKPDKESAKEIDLKAVRLCFQIFLCIEKPNSTARHKMPITPVVSEPIFDKRSKIEMKICNISDATAAATGGRKIMIFCGKVNRDDIGVRFIERIGNKDIWSAMADTKTVCVHHQVAIAFKVPPFRNEWIEQPTKNVMLQLFRPSDGDAGSGIRFTYTPDIEYMTKQQSMKRLRRNETQSRELYQLISDHLNDDKASPLQALSIHENALNCDIEVSCAKTMKRKRQKENRYREIIESLSEYINICDQNHSTKPNNITSYNIIKEEEHSNLQSPNNVSPIVTPNLVFNSTNPFAYDIANSNANVTIIDWIDEYKPQNTEAMPDPGEIYVDRSTNKNYHVLSQAQPPTPNTNPFRQFSNSNQTCNLFEEALQSLDGKNALPLLDLNSNDLACKSASASDPTTDWHANKLPVDTCTNVCNMTTSFSSLNL